MQRQARSKEPFFSIRFVRSSPTAPPSSQLFFPELLPTSSISSWASTAATTSTPRSSPPTRSSPLRPHRRDSPAAPSTAAACFCRKPCSSSVPRGAPPRGQEPLATPFPVPLQAWRSTPLCCQESLALLQEVGECEIVLSAGADALRNGIPASSGSSSPSASMPLPPSAERDVRLAMAHAHCTLAGATLEKGTGNGSSNGDAPASSGGDRTSSTSSVAATAAPISVACAHLAEAAALLAGAPVAPSSSTKSKNDGAASSSPSPSFPPLAPKLAADVARGLADLAPGCALEQLDLPLDQGHAPVRAAAVAVVAHALRAVSARNGADKERYSFSPSSAVSARPATPEFAKAALSRMGASEVAGALDWAALLEDPSRFEHWLFPGALGAAGAAHVVAGFVGRRPALVDLGEKLLAAEADAAAAVSAGASGGSPLAPRVAALVLLGEPEAAAELLTTSAHALEQQAASSASDRSNRNGSRSNAGLSSAAARARAAAADVEFVAAASRAVAGSGGDAANVDFLPGLVALTEEWLSRGGFPAFRDASERPPSPGLGGYFDDGRVAAALDSRAASKEREEGERRREGKRSGERGAVVSAAVGAAKGVAAAASLVASAIPLPSPAPPSLILPRVPGARAAASAAAASRGGRGLVSSLVASPLSTLAKFLGGAALLSAVAAVALSPSSRGPGGVGSVGGITARQQQQHAQQARQQQQQPRRSVFSGLGSKLQQQQKKRRSSSSPAAALPPAPVRSAGATSTSSSSTSSTAEARPSPLARFSISLASARAAAPPTQRQAEAAIGAWHSAKAAALGPRHDTSRLAPTTAEPWRSAVERDAAASRSSGWFWTFKLRGLRVEKVEAKGGRGGAAVTAAVAHARVREAGDLYARTGKRSEGHSYDNAYSAEYTLVRSSPGEGEGQWKVAGVLVTGEPRSRSA